jgi:hypothetical protein
MRLSIFKKSCAIAHGCVLVGLASTASDAGPTFSNVTTLSGITHIQADFSNPAISSITQSRMSGGAAAVDYDQDGWPDLYFTRLGASDLLYRNLGDGTFVDVTEAVFGIGFMAAAMTNGCGWADLDNDGDPDLFLTSLKSNRYHLWINDGQGSFTEEAVDRGVAAQGADLHYGFSVCFGDYDRDGYLDLHVNEWRSDYQNPSAAAPNTRLFRNLGAAAPGHFEDVTVAAEVELMMGAPAHQLGALAFTSRFMDIDRDGWQDLLVASDGGTSRLFWNNGDGTFTDGTDAAGVGTDEFGMGSTIGDFDGDGDLDWFVTSIIANAIWDQGTGNRLYRNDGGRSFSDATTVAGVRYGGWGWGTTFLDLDNDRDLDLMMVNGYMNYIDQTRLWENDGTGSFSNATGPSSGVTDELPATGLLTFDYDRDGDLDVVVVNNGATPILYRNDFAGAHDWLKISPVGVRSNREGIGAEILVKVAQNDAPLLRFVDGGSNFLSQNERLVHIGLGPSGSAPVAEIEIRWPSGITQVLHDVPRNQVISVTEAVDAPVRMNSASLLPDDAGVQVTWDAISGRSVVIECSTDLLLWEKIAVTRDSGEEGSWIDQRSPTSRLFYRAWR